MKTLIIIVLFVGTFASMGTTDAQAPDVPLNKRPIPEIVEHFASQYSVSADQMIGTMKCESSLNTHAVGDGGKSYGLAQIYLPAHPEVTPNQAFDPVFAAEFMAKSFAERKQSMWTCWRNLYKNTP